MAAKKADVTVAQVMDVRSMAIAKRLTDKDFQWGLNSGIFAVALDAAKRKKKVKLVSEGAANLVAPPWGRIHPLRIPVILDEPWQEAVNAVGSQTPFDHDVRKVGDLYVPVGKGVKEVEMVLVNLGKVGNFEKAVAWAGKYGLKRTPPRHVFSIGKHKPNLRRELGMNPIYVASSEECVFRGFAVVCGVSWEGMGRGARLGRAGGAWYSFEWVAFLLE